MIRPAEKKDAAAVVPIINIVLEEMELPFLDHVDQATFFKVLAQAFQTEDYRYSYRHGLVNEREGKVVGVAFGYPETAEAHIDDALQPFLPQLGVAADDKVFADKEAFPGEWYLDTLSVASEHQHQGVGSELLKAIPAVARQQGLTKVGLNVDVANPNARKLYDKMGFQVVGQVKLAGHDYEHMQLNV
ncbi:GNAT family N-acetyltransferase [Loigolactobacillus coryniformis]|uniref:GNAT family N-acetyltransferase n=2 Tax=Loigolactobacillus coryniformis TaxID=1610 RepID=A0A0R1F7H2_9LACO|nr:GNAT family N-acetyltransferase [Loigolactobacillus coryniformis]OEH89618.1 GNAT family acetyltransferase [Loigolactobacillus coryniformis subsp. coryniformis]ATO43252.1 GNAT family N-acetyltransferase [Loigolactobacillus coryniformis subsp. torquens DSM 20004 = KCTC 3535]ATO55022.1 GNAT family N-acetyltransferase [Loigolactobacillus coryniformis subsp. coryniformis KCTC 3167 = DSM 20001]KRK17502.1 GNAT family N-acetyltransferase [Loigolactobacillus coryniformis subsp. coryniformis KCTC 3167